MDEETVITTSEPSSSLPSETFTPVDVVPVDELIDRLLQSVQDGDNTGDTAQADDTGYEDPVEVYDPVPDLLADAVVILRDIRNGMDNVESIEQVVNHPVLTTPFQDYTVTEGLLLLLLLFFFLKFCMDMIRRSFSWLL